MLFTVARRGRMCIFHMCDFDNAVEYNNHCVFIHIISLSPYQKNLMYNYVIKTQKDTFGLIRKNLSLFDVQ